MRELLRALAQRDDAHRYLLYCREPWEEGALDERFVWRPIDRPDPVWHLAAAVRANRACDTFLSTNSYLTAWATRIPTAVVVYDLIAFLPEMRPQARAARIERATIGPALRRASELLCISEATEADLAARFPAARGKTAVIPLAADARFSAAHSEAELRDAAARHGVAPGGYVLAAGTLEPRKNLIRLIRAHSRLPRDVREAHPLLVVGPRGWEEEQILTATGEQAATVRLAGYVSDDDLTRLYAGCTVFAYPSLYEGFGLPVLEAMAAGAPVITSRTSSLPEVAGDAAFYVDPHDEDALCAALEALLGSAEERARLAAAGRERARLFTWDDCAAKTVASLERIAR